MQVYTGTYHCGDIKYTDARFQFFRDHLGIEITDPVGEQKTVCWFYRDILRSSQYLEQDRVVVRYTGYPSQWIELDNRMFIYELENRFNQTRQTGVRKVIRHRGSTLLKVMIGLLTLAALVYFWLVPFLAGKLASRVPVRYEVELGDAMFDNIITHEVIDERKTAYINEFFTEMNIRSPYPVRVTVVKGDIVNAFALPGGHIIVYDELLDELDHYEELAALLSHEYIHVQYRHATKSLFRKAASSAMLAILFGHSGSIANTIVSNADNLKDLSYSRSLEKEADLEGLRILAERHIDGKGFLELFDVLKKESTRQGIEVAEWISSHPDLDKRKQYVRDSKYFQEGGAEKNETLGMLFEKCIGH